MASCHYVAAARGSFVGVSLLSEHGAGFARTFVRVRRRSYTRIIIP